MGAQGITHGAGQPFYNDNGVGDLKGITDAFAAAHAANHGVHNPTAMPNLFPSQTNQPAQQPNDPLAAYKQAVSAGDQFSNTDAKGDKQQVANQPSPLDRIKAAFQSLKDMHKNDAPNGVGPGLGLFPGASASFPSVMGTAQSYMASQPQPGQPSPPAMASAPSGGGVPLPAPRPGGDIAQSRMGLAPYNPNGSLSEKDANSIYDDFKSSKAGQQFDWSSGQNPLAALFQRSTAMQTDPMGGGYIDPAAASAASQQPGIFSHLFG